MTADLLREGLTTLIADMLYDVIPEGITKMELCDPVARVAVTDDLAERLSEHFQPVEQSAIWGHWQFCVSHDDPNGDECDDDSHASFRTLNRPVFVFSLSSKKETQ